METEKYKIAEKFISRRSLPVNYREKDYNHFSHELIKRCNEVYIVKIPKVLLTANGSFHFPPFLVIPDELKKFNSVRLLPFTVFLKYFFNFLILRKLRVINSPHIIVYDNWTAGYFHWMCDVLPRLTLIRQDHVNWPIILPTHLSKLGYIKATLKKLGFKAFFLNKSNAYIFGNAYFISHFANPGNYNDLIIRELREILSTDVKTKLDSQFIYISRAKAGKRFINNELELIKRISELNFRIVYCEDLTLEQHAQLFTSTSVLVTNHGAGLTNMLFMKENTHVIEIRHENDIHNNCYFSLASALNINYYYSLSKAVVEGEAPHTADIIADISHITQLLKKILDHYTPAQ